MRPTLAWMCSAVVLGAACGGGSSSDSSSTTTVPQVSTTVAATTTSIETTTTTTEPSGLLPVPEELPLPPVASLVDVQVTLTPLLDIPHLLGMAWSQMAGYFFLITQDGQVFRTPPDFSSSEM
ncbi:MAG: hypothetical protein ACKOA6_00410, partial [Actinomycetota bacterium]